MSDLILTWPKSRSLDSYVSELANAERDGMVINFRVPTRPRVRARDRCFMVHDGAIRGYNDIVGVCERGAREVVDPITGGYWPTGIYVVRHPRWFPIDPRPMRGFQGYRYA